MSLRAQRGNLVMFTYMLRDCFVVPPPNDMFFYGYYEYTLVTYPRVLTLPLPGLLYEHLVAQAYVVDPGSFGFLL
jgi:hypothetical protein